MSQETDLIAKIYPYSPKLAADEATSPKAQSGAINLKGAQEVEIAELGINSYDYELAMKVVSLFSDIKGVDDPHGIVNNALFDSKDRRGYEVKEDIRVETYNPAIIDPNSLGVGGVYDNGIVDLKVLVINPDQPLKLIETAVNEQALVTRNQSVEQQSTGEAAPSRVKIRRLYNLNAGVPALEESQNQLNEPEMVESVSFSEVSYQTEEQGPSVPTNSNEPANNVVDFPGLSSNAPFNISYASDYKKAA